MENRKISFSCWNLNLDHLAHSLVTVHSELLWFPHHTITVKNNYLLKKPINHLFCVMEICCIQWPTQEFLLGGSTDSVEDRGQRDWGCGGGSPLVRGPHQFAKE
jgi:hypothetical protein